MPDIRVSSVSIRGCFPPYGLGQPHYISQAKWYRITVVDNCLNRCLP
jgi:hypothetical protein